MEISDELLHASAEKAAMLYLEEIDAVYAQEEDIKHSSRFLRHMRRMIRDEKRTPGERRFIRIAQRAAVAALVLFAGLFAATMSVEAFREQFISFITGRSSRATDFTYSIGNTEYYDADLTKTVFGYIPEGFEKVEDDSLLETAAACTFRFENKLTGQLFFINMDIYDISQRFI